MKAIYTVALAAMLLICVLGQMGPVGGVILGVLGLGFIILCGHIGENLGGKK